MTRSLRIFLPAVLLAMLGLVLPAHGADSAPDGAFTIAVSGEEIAPGFYAPGVTVEASYSGGRVLMKDKGRWALLPSGAKGRASVTFTESRAYDLTFCLETDLGQRIAFTGERFTVDGALDQFVRDCAALPDLAHADNGAVEAKRETITGLFRRYQLLREDQRAAVPPKMSYALSVYPPWLSRMKPLLDVTPPAPPEVRVEGDRAPGAPVYRGEARVVIRPSTRYDLANICVRRGGEEWTPLKKEADGTYVFPCVEPGEYRCDVCAMDAAGNPSPCQSVSLIVSPELYEFYENASSPDPVRQEQALGAYLRFNLYTCSLIGGADLQRLEDRCAAAWKQRDLESRVLLDGAEARAVGMLRAFPQGGVRFSAEPVPVSDATGAAEGAAGAGKKLLRGYRVGFRDAQGAPAAPGAEVLVRLMLPRDLLGRRGIAVFDEGGASRTFYLRGEDEGFALELPLTAGGVYYVAAEA